MHTPHLLLGFSHIGFIKWIVYYFIYLLSFEAKTISTFFCGTFVILNFSFMSKAPLQGFAKTCHILLRWTIPIE